MTDNCESWTITSWDRQFQNSPVSSDIPGMCIFLRNFLSLVRFYPLRSCKNILDDATDSRSWAESRSSGQLWHRLGLVKVSGRLPCEGRQCISSSEEPDSRRRAATRAWRGQTSWAPTSARWANSSAGNGVQFWSLISNIRSKVRAWTIGLFFEMNNRILWKQSQLLGIGSV